VPVAQDYEARIRRVLEYIHDNPEGDLSLDRLADVAAMSRFHWHRVFRGMTGETCAQAARRIRMSRAAALLVQTERPVSEIASRSGYANVRSFSRAFAESFGETPAAFRARGELREPQQFLHTGELPMFPIDIETHPARRVAAVPHRGPYPEISRAFAALGTILNSRGLVGEARGMVAIFYDDPSGVAKAELRSHAGVVVGDHVSMLDSLEEVRLPAGRHAVMHFRGPYIGLPAAYDTLYGSWLPSSGEEPADAPPFEIYHNTPIDTAPEDLRTDICIPLR
jgi:AraC family transcriptional regulator